MRRVSEDATSGVARRHREPRSGTRIPSNCSATGRTGPRCPCLRPPSSICVPPPSSDCAPTTRAQEPVRDRLVGGRQARLDGGRPRKPRSPRTCGCPCARSMAANGNRPGFGMSISGLPALPQEHSCPHECPPGRPCQANVMEMSGTAAGLSEPLQARPDRRGEGIAQDAAGSVRMRIHHRGRRQPCNSVP